MYRFDMSRRWICATAVRQQVAPRTARPVELDAKPIELEPRRSRPSSRN
jgi:hypothetical protein